jgi:small neutral amino acid transporter SnatA (MarC family)
MPGVALVLATLRLDVADRGGVLGQPGTELVTRISGLLVTAIAVQLVADAIGEFIREGV